MKKPSDLRKRGFLGDTVANMPADFRVHYRDWTLLYHSLNQFGQTVLHRCKVHNKNAQEVLLYCVFYRSLTAFQTVFLLIERGIDVEAKIILRSMTEALLVATATAKVQDFANRYIATDGDTRRKLLGKTVRVTKERLAAGHKVYLTSAQITDMENELATLDAQSTAKKLPKQMTQEAIAQEAGLMPFYLQHFALFSLYTHLTPNGMGDFLLSDGKGNIIGFRSGINDTDIQTNLRVSILLFLGVLDAVRNVFSLPIEKRLTSFCKKLDKVLPEI